MGYEDLDDEQDEDDVDVDEDGGDEVMAAADEPEASYTAGPSSQPGRPLTGRGSGRRGRPPGSKNKPKLGLASSPDGDEDSLTASQDYGTPTPRGGGRGRGGRPRLSKRASGSGSGRGTPLNRLKAGGSSLKSSRRTSLANSAEDEDDVGSQGSDEEEDDDEEDDDEEEQDEGDTAELPLMKKRPSRLRGYRLAYDNHQTTLLRNKEYLEEPDMEALKQAAAARRQRAKKAKKKLSRRKGLAASTRIIEDSEDEDSEDDRPRPRNSIDDEYDENAVLPNEEFKVRVGGQDYTMLGDELQLPDHPAGEQKIDKNGNLLGNRKYKLSPFTSSMRSNPHRVYVLSVDAARACGFRDSLSLFRSDLRLIKISLLQQEKEDLIAAGRLNGQLKGRNVTMLGVRNIYKIFGAKVVKNGRSIVDDYDEDAVRARFEEAGRPLESLLTRGAGDAAQGSGTGNAAGAEEKDIRTEAQRKRDADRERDRSKRPPDAVTVHINNIPTTFGDNGASPFMRSINWPTRRMNQRRADLSEENWMLEMSRNVRGMNAELAENRRERLMKFSDPTGQGDYQIDDDEVEEEQDADMSVSQADIKMDVDDASQVDGEGDEDVSDLSHEQAMVARERRYQDLYNPRAPPVGLYDPTTNLPHFSLVTQPKRARVEKIMERPMLPGLIEDVPPMKKAKTVLLGSKYGSGALGVATWSTSLNGSVTATTKGDGSSCWQVEMAKGHTLKAGTGGED